MSKWIRVLPAIMPLVVGLALLGLFLTQPTETVRAQNLGGSHYFSATTGATKTAVKTAPGVLYSFCFYNSNAAASYVQVFDATAANVTLGTTPPSFSFGMTAASAYCLDLSSGVQFNKAITYAVTTTRSGSTGPASTVDVNFAYD